MKIEFCCKEMEDYFVRQDTCVFELCNTSLKEDGEWIGYCVNKDYKLTDTCPYCGSKIEISVKEER